MEILRRNQKEMPEIKNTVIEMKNSFDRVISSLDMPSEKTRELENMSVETS